jgi:hypothetical protein
LVVGLQLTGLSRGDFKNGGRELRPKSEPEPVRVHDFKIPELGKRCYGASDAVKAQSSLQRKPTECPMPQLNDLSRCLAALDQDSTLIAVIEMSRSTWLVTGIVPGVERHPAKKLEPDEGALLGLLHRWRDEAGKAGRMITRIAVAFEAGRDGFWLARWLRARSVGAYVIHATSVAVSREHRRAKTDRLDSALLKRAFLG